MLDRLLTNPRRCNKYFAHVLVKFMCPPFFNNKLLSKLLTMPCATAIVMVELITAPLSRRSNIYDCTCLSSSSPNSRRRPLFLSGSSLISISSSPARFLLLTSSVYFFYGTFFYFTIRINLIKISNCRSYATLCSSFAHSCLLLCSKYVS